MDTHKLGGFIGLGRLLFTFMKFIPGRHGVSCSTSPIYFSQLKCAGFGTATTGGEVPGRGRDEVLGPESGGFWPLRQSW